MSDLLKKEERDNLILFAEHFFEAIENNIPTVKNFKPVTYAELKYTPGDVGSKVDIGNKKVVIVTDSEDGQPNLGRMIERFTKSFSNEVEVINLHDVDIKGGCLGCLQCGYDNTCSYGDKDGYMEFYNTKIKTAGVLVLSGTIKDRYLSSRWKIFFDRSFFNGHAPTWTGKQVGFIISGPLSQVPNLRQILEAWVQMQQANLVDFITDEYEDSAQIDALLQTLAGRVVKFADENYIKPPTFLGVGGRKIFRDEIWGLLRPTFQADHRFYVKHGIYDFPQKKYKKRIQVGIFMLLTKLPQFRKVYAKRIKPEMIKPLQKVVEKE